MVPNVKHFVPFWFLDFTPLCQPAASPSTVPAMPDPPASPPKPIALIGLMGSGKSTIGARLAGRLRLPFVDSDAEIELAARMSIAELFEAFGEEGFRDGERRVIARLMEGPRRVIATGGGAWMDARTRALLDERALVIWLRADIEVLVERVGRRNHRPLLVGRDPGEVLRALADRRDPVYATAHMTIDSGTDPHAVTVRRIVAALAREGPGAP